jgi:hypothetical protein
MSAKKLPMARRLKREVGLFLGGIMIARFARVLLLCGLPALAAPPLTTIQDVLYRADGSKFNGLLQISWKSFEASDHSNILTQSLSVRVTAGALKVSLVPTTTATPVRFYTVRYNSDGKVQFEETWAVPESFTPLRVRDVRLADSSQIANETTGPITEADVAGLTVDLAARPVKASAYAPGRVVFANSQGALESVSGQDADCVRVDGSTGPCGGADNTSFIDAETPAGTINGANAAFTLAYVPSPAASLMVYRNGLLMKLGLDFTLSNRTLTFLTGAIPQAGDTLLAAYRMSGSATAYPGPQVLCSGVGATINLGSDSSLGTCTIPSGLLTAGDRVEIRFALQHGGTAGGFHFDVKWGTSYLIQRDGGSGDVLVSGRGDAVVLADAAQLSGQSWGTVLPLAGSVTTAAESGVTGVTVEFFGRVSAAGSDTLALKNFTVIRFP